jgi:hypothetical protein
LTKLAQTWRDLISIFILMNGPKKSVGGRRNVCSRHRRTIIIKHQRMLMLMLSFILFAGASWSAFLSQALLKSQAARLTTTAPFAFCGVARGTRFVCS